MFDIKLAKRRYHAHKCVARQRKVEFDLTFDDWYTIWINSGHYPNRGAGKGKYVMSRVNDIGPYKVGNVFIQPFEKNISDAKKGKCKTQEHINNWRESYKNNKKQSLAN